MANPGSINWNGYMLPAGLRDLLGIPAPEPQPVATPADVLAPPPVVQPPPAPPVQNAPDFAIAPPVEPKYGKQLAASNKAAAKSQAQQDAAAASQGFRMPTLAQAVGEQQAATEDQARAVAGETAVAAKTADDVYAAQLDAQRKLEENDAALKAQQEQSDRIRADKQMAADALMAQADATKVDMGRYWSDANTGKKVGWLISMAMSGLGDVLAGKSGPNPVIGMLEQTIDKDVRQQEMNRAAIKERAQRASDAVDAFDRFSANQEARILARRAQAKELVAQQLAVATAKYGSEAAIANGQKNIALIRKSSADDKFKAADVAYGHAMQEEQARNARAQVGLGYARLAQDKVEFKEKMKLQQDQLDLEAAKLAQAGQKEQAKLVAEKGIPGVYNKDGTPMVATGSSPEDLAKVKDRVAATQEVVDIIDKIRRTRTGWTSDTANSPENQKLKSEWQALRLKAKDMFALGVIAGPDLDLIDGFFGAKDPTQRKSFGDAIETARSRVLKGTNIYLKSRGLDGEFDIPDFAKNAPAEQPGDADYTSLIQSQNNDYDKDIGRKLAEMGAVEGDPQSYTVAREKLRAEGIVPYQKQFIDTMAAGVNSPDPKVRDLAVSRLKDAAEKAEAPAVRAYAQQKLNSTLNSMAAAPGVMD